VVPLGVPEQNGIAKRSFKRGLQRAGRHSELLKLVRQPFQLSVAPQRQYGQNPCPEHRKVISDIKPGAAAIKLVKVFVKIVGGPSDLERPVQIDKFVQSRVDTHQKIKLFLPHYHSPSSIFLRISPELRTVAVYFARSCKWNSFSSSVLVET